MKEKQAKAIFWDDFFCRNIHTQNERVANSDPDHVEYVRKARSSRNLPNSYDTQWIKKVQSFSWKDRCRKSAQYLRHRLSRLERKHMLRKEENDLMSILNNHQGWYKVDVLKTPYTFELLRELLKDGRIELKSPNWQNFMYIRKKKRNIFYAYYK